MFSLVTRFLGFYCTNTFFFRCAIWIYLKSLNGVWRQVDGAHKLQVTVIVTTSELS